MNNLVTNRNLRLIAGSTTSDGNAAPAGTIQWKINNLSLGFKSVLGFVVSYILTYRVVHSLITGNNNWLARMGIVQGGSVGFNTVTIGIIARTGKSLGYIRGNATNFTLTGDLGGYQNMTNTVAEFHFTPQNLYANNATQHLGIWKNAFAKYVGTTANRRVIKITPTGSATFAFRLIDTTTGLAVTTNTTADIIEIGVNQGVSASLTNANSSGGSVGNNLFRQEAKINMIGILEL